METIKDNIINVRDKQAMRSRCLSTRMVEAANIHIEAWTPEDEAEIIMYEYVISVFGEVLIAATSKGICYAGFTRNDRQAAFDDLRRRFPQQLLTEGRSPFRDAAIGQMEEPERSLPIRLHLRGTGFQLAIWKKLTAIPLGGLITYAQLGGGSRNARATGSAVGSNPVGFLIPCHRAIRSDGSFDRYFWGTDLKEKLLAWESGDHTVFGKD